LKILVSLVRFQVWAPLSTKP